MVKNTKGGNKTKKLKRNFDRFDPINKIEPDQMFGKITHNNGGSFSVLCSDGITRLGKLTSEMKKGPRLTDGSFVVISLRIFETNQKHCDIISHGDPPFDIKNILKCDLKANSNNTSALIADIEFVDSDDEFKEFENSKMSSNKTDDVFDWNDV